MEREQQIEPAELTNEELESVQGGAFRFLKAIMYWGSGTQDGGGSGNNPQIWVQSAT